SGRHRRRPMTDGAWPFSTSTSVCRARWSGWRGPPARRGRRAIRHCWTISSRRRHRPAARLPGSAGRRNKHRAAGFTAGEKMYIPVPMEAAMTLTREQVVSVLGPMDDETIAEIMQSGASFEELQEAWAWANGDEALMGQGRPLPGTRVGTLIE